MRNSSTSFKALIIASIFWLIAGIGIGWSINSEEESVEQEERNEDLDLSLFWDVWESVQDKYFDITEITEEDELYGSISGLVDSLDDPYSVFMNPDETLDFQSSLNGELEGIGAELTVRDGKLVVVSPLKDSPAEEAGLLPGDFIYLVDGEPTSEMTLFDAIMNIRGEPGTDVILTIIRNGYDNTIDISVTRQKIVIPSIDVEFIERGSKDIAVLSIYQFADDTYNEFMDAVRELTLEDPDALVLDLRMNGGGYLDVSIEIMSEFFEDEVKGVIVKRRNQENDITYTKGDGDLSDIPVVVLIDEGSASASEILAGALQDYDRALILGETSFGKGSVQELSTLLDGSSLRLTVAKWYTPNDRTIDEIGITPDVIVEMESTEIDTENDVQLNAALDYLAKQ